MAGYGCFSGNPRTEWLSDLGAPDRDMRLLEEFSYTDPDGRVWAAPKGGVVNGASIPRPLWATVGSPYTDDYRNASIVHDIACDDPNVAREDADKMFYFACLAGGCTLPQAALLYLGVRIGAWASEVKKWRPFSRAELLYRLPGQREASEATLFAKYAAIAVEIGALGETPSFAQVDALVRAGLTDPTGK